MKTHSVSFHWPLILLLAVVAFSSGCNLAGDLRAMAVATPPSEVVARPPTVTPSLLPGEAPTQTPVSKLPTATPTVPPPATLTIPAAATAAASPSEEKAPAFIVFTVEGTEDSTYPMGIYRINPDGTDLTLLRPFAPNDWGLDVSPDGQKMLYSVDKGDDIYLVNIDGSNPVNLTNTPKLEEYFASWSPDGRLILYDQYCCNDRPPSLSDISDVYVMNADGTHRVNLTENQPGYSSMHQVWSPDGQRIAFASGTHQIDTSEVYVMNADGTGRLNVSNLPGDDYYPLWLPDGQRLAFYNFGLDTHGIYLVNADGAHQVQLTIEGLVQDTLVWSPDGRWVAFLEGVGTANDVKQDPNAERTLFGLFIANADGTDVTRLTDPGLDASGEEIAWSPDGTRLAFSAALVDGSGGGLYVVNVDGSGLTRLTDLGASSIEWVSSNR